ncbi:MAG: hypothetical protein VX519_00835 [Myxococcota bacterium]|nr:hypothetical protein [Myxococcota bacterium]
MSAGLLWPQTRTTGPWIWGRGVDLFWIAGGGFFAFLFIAVSLSQVSGAAALVTTTFLHLSILCNYPHYTATYQLLLLEGKGRQLLVTSLAMVGLLVITAFYQEALWGLVMRLYLSLSVHHYASQNFGIAVLYGHRRGPPLTPDEKRSMQRSFLGLALFMILSVNTSLGYISGNAGGAIELIQGVQIPLAGFPAWVYQATLIILAISFGAFVQTAYRYRTRTGSHLPLAVFCLFATNLAWFVIPSLGLPSGASLVPPEISILMLGAIPFFHCAQYLFVTFDRNRQTHPTRPIWLYVGLVVTGFILFHAPLPVLPTLLSLDSLKSSFLLIAIINLHHFWIDGLIWRKRSAKRPVATGELA